MINRNKLSKVVVHDEFEQGKLIGVSLMDAARHLLDLAKALPADATIEDVTESYDPTCLEVHSHREETDEEYSYRIEVEEIDERRRADAERKRKEEEARRKQWEELNKEFGGYRR